MTKTITFDELKPGDIMLFSIPEHSWISSVIGFLTHSKVSHTGMVDYNPAYVLSEIEEGASRYILDPPGVRTLYIRRLKNEPDTTKVVEIAKKYVDENIPYTDANLAFIGLYIITSDFIPDSIAGQFIKSILQIATYEIIKLVNSKFHPDSEVPPMVCSQFAAKCYDDAVLEYGPEYKIHYNEEVKTVATLLTKIIDQLDEDEDKTFTIKSHKHKVLQGISEGIESLEEHCEKLMNHIKGKEDSNKSEKISDEVISEVYQYAKWFLRLFDNKTEYEDDDKEQVTASEVKSVLEELFRFQETFITPEDLLSNTTNLEDMGILTYTQEELDMHDELKN